MTVFHRLLQFALAVLLFCSTLPANAVDVVRAYAALSPRTELSVLQEFAQKLQYRPVSFHSYDRSGTPVYHTNVMMSVGI